MDPIVILAIVIGVSVFLVIITAVGLLILVRSRCTLSPPEPTLITYHPHSNTMETSFTEVPEEETVKRQNTSPEVEDKKSDTASPPAVTSSEEGSLPDVVDSAPNSTQLLVTIETLTRVRPRPRPSFAEKRKDDESHPLKSSRIHPVKGDIPSKPTRTEVMDKKESTTSPNIKEVGHVVLRKKKRPMRTNSFQNTKCEKKDILGNNSITTVATIESSAGQGKDFRRSEPVFSKPNPIDAMHSALLSMDTADDNVTSPVSSYALLHSYEDLAPGDGDEFNECVNPLYVSSQTIDSRVASFMMRPNPCLPSEQADLSDSLQFTWCNNEESPHICSPEYCHYPVFFTQSCPNSPLFVRKLDEEHPQPDTHTKPESDDVINSENNNSQNSSKNGWKSETNLSLLNHLNGCNVYLRPAMNGEQLLNAHVCPSAWLISPQYIDDRWEMRTTFWGQCSDSVKTSWWLSARLR